jgi:60 kDa SS-A/Ro ribonucleoprotein
MVFSLDDLRQLRRFLILGSDKPTYYASDREMTEENADVVKRLVDSLNGERAVGEIGAVSEGNLAAKNDPALFALAMALSAKRLPTKQAAALTRRRVARYATHWFHLAQFLSQMRGTGRLVRRVLAEPYVTMSAQALAYQAVKYAQRDGWSHADLIRLSHPIAPSPEHHTVYQFMLHGYPIPDVLVDSPDGGAMPNVAATPPSLGAATAFYDKIMAPIEEVHGNPRISKERRREMWLAKWQARRRLVDEPDHPAWKIITGAERIKRAKTAQEAADLVADYGLPHEAVPSQFKAGQPENAPVWLALLTEMLTSPRQATALIRNLPTMTRSGVFQSEWALARVAERLVSPSWLKEGGIHPIAMLNAFTTYQRGQSTEGNTTWTPVPPLVEALETGFYAAFGAVTATNKRIVLALDVSGSMGSGSIGGLKGLTPRVASAAMAMVTLATEPNARIVAFTSINRPGSRAKRYMSQGMPTSLESLPIRQGQKLDAVLKVVDGLPMGGTDCALPMVWAAEERIEADAFIIYTDNETWAGDIHPVQALDGYAIQMGIAARLIVVGMTSTGYSIADPTRTDMLDVVGFDASAPELMARFILGEV